MDLLLCDLGWCIHLTPRINGMTAHRVLGGNGSPVHSGQTVRYCYPHAFYGEQGIVCTPSSEVDVKVSKQP